MDPLKGESIRTILGSGPLSAYEAELQRQETLKTIEALKAHLEALDERIAQPLQKPKREETTIKQQLLILYYLGFIDTLPDITKEKKYEMLGTLLNRGKQGIKEDFDHLDDPPHLYNIKTERNLKFVIDYFENFGLKDSAEKAKKELNEIKSRKL